MIIPGSNTPTSSTPLAELNADRWDARPPAPEQAAAERLLESGAVLFLPRLAFTLTQNEQCFLSPTWADPKAKNISFDPVVGSLRGARGSDAERAALRAMIERFGTHARSLIRAIVPRYTAQLKNARTSFRPMPVAGREGAWRKDDRLLHIDAFPSRPNRGDRILRVFTNVNPLGEARVWRLGEPFEAICTKLLPRIRAPIPGAARALAALHVTKGERSRYDHIMLQLHDLMKSDAAYQRTSPRIEVRFPPDSTWVCFSDQVSHSVIDGQYLLEHTILLPLSAMAEPQRSPLRILERLTRRALA